MNRKRSLWLLALIPVALLVWAMKGAASWRPQLIGAQSGAVSCQISPDGRYLLLGKSNGGSQMWDLESQNSLWSSNGKFALFSEDGNAVVLAKGAEGLPLEPLRRDSFSDQMHFDMVRTQDGVLLRSFSDTKHVPTKYLHDSLHRFGKYDPDRIKWFRFSPDGKQFRLATEGHFWRWDAISGKLLTVGTLRSVAPDMLLHLFNDEPTPPWKSLSCFFAYSWTFSPDYFSYYGEHNCYASSSRASYSRAVEPLWQYNEAPTFSPDGKLAYLPTQNGLDVIEAHTGRKLRTLPGPTTSGFVPSPDGNWLYEVRDGKIYRWRAS